MVPPARCCSARWRSLEARWRSLALAEMDEEEATDVADAVERYDLSAEAVDLKETSGDERAAAWAALPAAAAAM